MFEAMLEISLFAFPLAAICLFLGWWAAKNFSSKEPHPLKPPAAPRLSVVKSNQEAEFIIKSLRSELLQLRTELEEQRAKAKEWELLLELSETKSTAAPEMVKKVMGNDGTSLPVESKDWTIVVLKQRIRELERTIIALKP
jgi:hypothetical protein